MMRSDDHSSPALFLSRDGEPFEPTSADEIRAYVESENARRAERRHGGRRALWHARLAET